MLKITWYVAILKVFNTFAHKVAQTWFVWHETWYTPQFGILLFRNG